LCKRRLLAVKTKSKSGFLAESTFPRLHASGGYVFNTEAHPIDVSALHCCNRGRSSSDFSEARKRLRDFDPELAHETNPRTRDSNRHPRVYDDSNAVGLPSHHSRNATSLEQRTSCAAPPYHVKFMRLGQIFVDD